MASLPIFFCGHGSRALCSTNLVVYVSLYLVSSHFLAHGITRNVEKEGFMMDGILTAKTCIRV